MGLTLTPPKPIAPQPLAQVLPVALKLGEDLNVWLSPIAAGEPWLQCNASLAGTNFGAVELARLAAVGLNLRWLDLGGTGLRDADLALLAQMPNLTRLHLERTAITDSALGHVSKLASLEYLNLHHTEVTDAGLEALRPLANLRQLYLWETKVSPAAVELLTKTLAHEEQLAQWREEIELLQAKVRQAKVVVDLGSRVPPPSPPTNSLVNPTCPVSGKPVDASKTLVQDGKTVAFCWHPHGARER